MRAKKSLGQNFISDPQLIESIIDAAGITENDTVLEIGPGRGALTYQLCDRAKEVIAVELDKDLIPVLKTTLAFKKNFTLYNEDILQFDFRKVLGQETSEQPGSGAVPVPLKIIGNLPYYITTPIILGLFEKAVPVSSMTFMVQKEVAERIVAGPGGKDYGVLSISVQYYSDAKYALDVPREYFSPQPKVDSAVVHLTTKKERPLKSEDEKEFFSLVKTAFSQRRKTLANCLTGFKGKTKEEIGTILDKAGIDQKRRPETLSIPEFLKVFETLKNG